VLDNSEQSNSLDEKKEDEKKRERAGTAAAIGLGSTLTVGFAGFTVAGYLLSEKFHNIAWLLGGIAVAFIFGIWEVIKIVKIFEEKN